MTSAQIERANEQAQVALDGEMRLNQASKMIRSGNLEVAKTHLEQALHVCQRLLNELTYKRDNYGT